MCAPVALGALSAGVGVIGAYGQHQAQNAQVAANNKASIQNYKYQLKMRERNWDRERFIYSQRISEYKGQVLENNSAAQRAYAAEQRKLNEVYTSASLSNQAMAVELLSNNGRTAARGITGRSANRVDAQMISAYGRNQAVLAQSLTSARQANTYAKENIRESLASSNRQAFSQVAIAPQPGMAPQRPVMQQPPSSIGLLTGIAGAALDGYGTYNSLKAPNAYVPLPV